MSQDKPKRKSVYESKTTGKVKVKFSTTIDADLFERFRRVANEVFGLQRGSLEYALEEAIQLWLQVHAAGNRPRNPSPGVREKYNAVISCIEEGMGMVPITVPQLVFEACIKRALNVKTDRTVREYLHTFYQLGLIKPLTIEKPTSPSDWKKNKSIELVARKA